MSTSNSPANGVVSNQGNPRACIFCKHYSANGYSNEMKRCDRRTQKPGLSPVTNLPYEPEEIRWPWCNVQRGEGWLWTRLLGVCGKEGRFWELKR